MRFENEGMSLWYGTPDAPGPGQTVQADADVPITIGAHPVNAGNHVEVHYRVNQGKTQRVAAKWLRNDPVKKAQYFRVRLPAFRAGDTVEYSATCRCAGWQVPSPEDMKQSTSFFRVAETGELTQELTAKTSALPGLPSPRLHSMPGSSQGSAAAPEHDADKEEADVRDLQLQLRSLGFYTGRLTGIFDQETETAVDVFRKKQLVTKPVEKQSGLTQGIVDQTTAEAINAAHELLQARRRFGIPDMESAAISRLQIVGVSQLSDILRSDADQLLNRTNLDRELLARLRNTAVISNFTGLNPRNAYALVQVGEITSVDQLQALSEEELRNIFKTAQDRGMLSDPDQAQIDFFLGTVAARSKMIFSDVRSVFPTIEEDEAVKLASIDIFRGRDLRSIDVEVVAAEIGLDHERLDVLKKAAELIQIRGITPKLAIALAGKGRVGGIRRFADIDGATLLEILESLKQDGELELEEADISEPQAEEMIEAAQEVECQSDLCSDRAYFEYLISLLNFNVDEASTTFEEEPENISQAILTLQEQLCQNGKSFSSSIEWCSGERSKHFPESAYQFKLPLIVSENDSIDTIRNQVEHLPTIVPSGGVYGVLRNNLERIPKIIDADYRIFLGHQEFANMEFGSALRHYTTAESNLLSTIPFYIGNVKLLEDLGVGNNNINITKDSLANKLIQSINIRWGIESLFENFVSDLPESISTMEELYKDRRAYNQQTIETDGSEDLTEVLGSNLILLHVALAQSDVILERYGVKFLSVVVDRTLSLIMHYLYFLIPIAKADTYHELGNYRNSNFYYNLVYDLGERREVYPFLNPIIELPLIKIRHGANLLEWAESLYRENTAESIRQAKCLYEKVLDLHDDCLANSEDQFIEMSNAINALSDPDLNYENIQTPSSFEQVIRAVGKIQHRSVPASQIPDLFRMIAATIPDRDERNPESLSKAAVELSTLLDLEIRFSPLREVFVVAEVSDTPSSSANAMTPSTSSGEGGQFFSTTTLADTLPASTPCKPPCNPVIEAQVQRALMRLSQIKRGVNILGYRDDLVPILRYSYLVNQARMFVQLAVAAEKDFIQFLSNAEQESFNQLTAQQAVAIAAANLRVEQARANIAQQRIELAKLQKGQLEQEIKDLGAEIADASDSIFRKAELAQAYEQHAAPIAAFGIQIGTIANQWTGGEVGKLQRDIHIWGSENVAVGRESPIEVQIKAAKAARKNHIKKLERQKMLLENYGLAIADQQINIAMAEHELTQRQVAVGQLQVEHARQILFFLQTKFLNKELWYELAKEIRAIYRKLLDYAITAAFLAEQALEYEMDQQLNAIRFDYYRPDRHGLLGAENLQADIATLEYQKIALTENKKIPVKAVISLGEDYPQELMRFTTSGRTHFATDFGQFDLLYPGVYQSRISRVEVVIEGLVPPEGIHGTLSTSGISYARTRENQVQPLAGNPETMILSSYTIRGDQVVFYKTGEELELFEGLGVVTDWTLEMPKAANNMNYQTITDVKLVIYYTALFDDSLRNLVIRRWPKGGDAYRGFSMRFQYPDGFYHFNNNITKTLFSVHKSTFVSDLEEGEGGTLSPELIQAFECHGISLSSSIVITAESEGNKWQLADSDNNQTYVIAARGETLDIYEKDGDKHRATLTFETSDAYFPTNQEYRQIVNLNIVMVSADTPLPAPLSFTLCSEPQGGGAPVVATAEFARQKGFRHVRASSNVDVLEADGTPQTPESPLNVFAGLHMNRRWELQIDIGSNDPNDANFHPEFFKQNDAGDYIPDLSQIVDILFFVEYQYDRPDLTIAEHFNDGAANWLPVDISIGYTDEEYIPWQVKLGHYCGSDPRLQSRLDVNRALSHLPSETADNRKQLISDHVMIAYRTKLCSADNNRNFSLFYFAGGYYCLMLTTAQDVPTNVALWKLSRPYNTLSTTELLGTSSSQELLIRPDRWYTVEVGKFGGRIDVSIDGAEVLNVVDREPKEGPGIGVGTGGTGSVYFDDILI